MRNADIEHKVEKIVETLIDKMELELVDVEYVRESGWYLRIFLDKENGLEIEDCQFISEKLAQILDENDFIKDRYYLEVSSPGLDKELKKDRELTYYKNALVDVQMEVDKKPIVGILGDTRQDTIEICVDDKPLSLERKNIKSIRLHLDF